MSATGSVHIQLRAKKMTDVNQVKRWLANWLADYQTEFRHNPCSSELPRLRSEINVLETRVYELEHQENN